MESYSAIYTSSKFALWGERNRVSYFVLECLAIHCDQLGITFVGVQRIGDLVGYSPSSVRAALDDLQNRGYIAIQSHNRGHTIQISPDVIVLRQELQIVANKMWFVMKHIQPDNQNNQNNQKNQNNQITKEPPPPPKTVNTISREDGITADIEPQKQKTKEKSKEQKPVRSTKTVRSTETEKLPPGSAQPPISWGKPLADMDSETMAHVIQSRFQTRLPQSRKLVMEYGLDTVKAGIEWLQFEMSIRAVQSPIGLLNWWLKNQFIDDGSIPNKYTSSEYGQYLETGME